MHAEYGPGELHVTPPSVQDGAELSNEQSNARLVTQGFRCYMIGTIGRDGCQTSAKGDAVHQASAY